MATTHQLVYDMVDRELSAHGNFSTCDRQWLADQIVRQPGLTKKALPEIIRNRCEDYCE